MNKWILIFLTLTASALAQLDLNLSASGRSYPSIGGNISLESGYNFILWEKEPKLLYGMIRPAVYGESSLVINTYGAKIGFYPVSFFGIELGKETTNSQYENFTYYDCSKIACKGIMEKDYITYTLGLGAGPVIGMATITQFNSKYDYELKDAPVAEFVYATLADPKSDSTYVSRYVIGLKALGGFIGIVSDFAHTEKTTQTFNSNYLLYGLNTESGSYNVGIGNLVSDEVDPAAVLYFKWSYWVLPSRLLF